MYPTVVESTTTHHRFGKLWFSILCKDSDQPKFSYFSPTIEGYSSRDVAVNLFLGDETEYFIRVPYASECDQLEFTDVAMCYICGNSSEKCVSINVEEGIANGSHWRHSEEKVCEQCVTELPELADTLIKKHKNELTAELL